MFKVFVKDSNALNEKFKVEMIGLDFDVGEDLEATQNGKIIVSQMFGNVKEGDVVFIVSNKGKILYTGLVKSIKDTTINTSQITELFNDIWLYDIDNESSIYLEDKFSTSLSDYCVGKITGSSYIDLLRKKQLETLKVNVRTHTEGQYEEQKEEYTTSITNFIYEMYEKFNIVVRPIIPLKEWNIGSNDARIDIFKPNYDEIFVSDNATAIQNLTIKTSVEATNKLVVFSKGTDEEPSTYRTTYIYTLGGILEEPQTIDGRLNKIKTKIIFSDDDIATLIASNLPSEMFNHEIKFSLIIDNKIYKWENFKLGMPIKLFSEGHTYYSVLTAYKIKQDDTTNDLIYADITLGKVRTSLTKKLKTNYGIGGN